jgi:probable phosphoglycerate mutase
MKLLLVRHGETMWNVQKKIQGSTDIELNQNGKNQAALLGKTLKEKKINISKIYTSKQKRAKETAEIVKGYLNVECVELNGLEEMNLGLWEGKSWEDVAKEFPLEYQTWFDNRRYTRPPKGESYQDLLDRLFPALKQIIKTEKEDVLIVTHSADIMTLLSFLNDKPFSQMVENYKIYNTSIIEIDSMEISKL